jgi:hypothetical protein
MRPSELCGKLVAMAIEQDWAVKGVVFLEPICVRLVLQIKEGQYVFCYIVDDECEVALYAGEWDVIKQKFIDRKSVCDFLKSVAPDEAKVWEIQSWITNNLSAFDAEGNKK